MSSSRTVSANGIDIYVREQGEGPLVLLCHGWPELSYSWRIHQPSLFIAGSRDSVITGLIGAKRVGDMERVLPNLRQKLIIDGAGHWIQQERAQEVNAALIAFLRENAA